MRDRAAAPGAFQAGPGPDGGFTVRAAFIGDRLWATGDLAEGGP